MTPKLAKLAQLTTFVLGAVLLVSCGSPEVPKKETVRTLPAMKVGDVAEIEGRNFPGRAKATQEVDLAFRVSGPLITFPVNVGDKVETSALLARLDPRDFEVQQRNAEGQLQRAQANLERSEKEYKRLLAIRKKDPELVSEVHIDRTKEAFQLAKADIAALQATVDSAQDNLSYTYLKAPFDGTVVATYVENFEYVRDKQPVVRLLDNKRIEFMFSVPETFISLVPLVKNVRVHFDAFPDVEIPAEFKEIGSEASLATRTYPITLIMDQPKGIEILPGMAGKASGEAPTVGEGETNDIVVPVNAVFSPKVEETSYVWIIDESANTVSRREVRLGNLVSSGVVVRSGLKTGDLIAIAGVHYLTEGQRVKPNVQ